MTLRIHVTPKAKHSEILGPMVDERGETWLKVKVAAPPHDGLANDALIKFLAKSWGVARSELEIVSGHTSRYKRLSGPPSADAQWQAATAG